MPEVSYHEGCKLRNKLSIYWIAMHTMAAHYPTHPSKKQQHDTWKYIYLTGKVLPCHDPCGTHWCIVIKLLKKNKNKIMQSRSSLFQFLFDIHNLFSMNMGKPQMIWPEAVALYDAHDVTREPNSELDDRSDIVEHMLTMTNVSTLYAHTQWAKEHKHSITSSRKEQYAMKYRHQVLTSPISDTSTTSDESQTSDV